MVSQSKVKKVLALDLLCPKGHVAFDSGIIDALGQCAIVHAAVAKGYFGQEPPHGASVVYEAPAWLFTPASRLGFRVKQLLVVLCWAVKLRLDSYDVILVLSYETISLLLSIGLFGRRVHLYVFDHVSLDDLASRVKQWSFQKLSRRVHHLVLEQYMVAVVRRFGGPMVHVSVIPHPMRYFSAPETEDVKDDSGNACLSCVGPSQSNDESFIEWMIHEETSTNVLRQHSVSLVLHSKNSSFDDGWLRVYGSHLNDNAYETLLRGADLVVLPYPQTFANRVSGVLLEALACRKHWIGTDTPMFRDYALMYPMLGQVCQTYEELLIALLQVTREELRMTPDSAWDAVANAHSRAAIAVALAEVLELSQ